MLPDEIIKHIFEYAGEYNYYPQFKYNNIVFKISPFDFRYILLKTIPKKVVIKNTNTPPYKHFHILIEFGIVFADLLFRMSFKDTEFLGGISEETGHYMPKSKEYCIYFTKVDRRHTVYQSLKIYSHTLK